MLWGIFSGVLDMISYFLYCKLMKIGEASRVVPILYLNVFFTALLAFFFFGEVFTIPKYLGMLALVVGAILLSYKKQLKSKKKGLSIIKNLFIIPILIPLILTCFLFASVNIIDKYILFSVNYWVLLVWSVIGEITVTLFMLLNKKIRKNFVASVNVLKTKKKSFGVVLANEVFGFLAIIISLIAISLGPVSLVTALFTIQPLFVFILTIVLSLFMPKILKEEINKSTLSLKLFSILLMIFGTWLVTV
jgi:drug/metabolite transporter (DMT)-like permease